MFPIDNFFHFLQTTLGVFLFIPLYALWVSFLLPGVWASMLAGALYGTWIGSCLVFFGASLGALISFLLARTILRDVVQKKFSKKPKLLAIEQAVSREGLKLILLTRLSPVFPFSLLNFAYGLSKVSIKEYTIGLMGILPGTILFCNLGSLAGTLSNFNRTLSDNQNFLILGLRVLGIAATIGIVVLISRTSTRILQELDSSN